MSTQIPPSTASSMASVALKIIAFIVRVASYTPYVLFIIFSVVQVFMSLAVLADNGMSVAGVVAIILMLILLAPLLMKGGSLDMTTSIAASDIALSIGFWLIVLAVFDVVLRKIRHKPIVDIAPRRWINRKIVLIYTGIYLVSTCIMLVLQPSIGETLLVQILFYLFGLVCYVVSSSIKLLARALFVKSSQMIQTSTTPKT